MREPHTRILLLREAPARPGRERGIRAYCVLQSILDEVAIHNLAVAPEERGRGLARRLLALALHLEAQRGVGAAHLEVRAGNEAALRLYRRLGFQATGRRPGYYQSPREDAVLLSLRPLPAPPRPSLNPRAPA